VVLSKREQYIGIAAAGALIVLCLDHFALDPLLTSRDRVEAEIRACQLQHQKVQRLFKTRSRKSRAWSEMLNKGLQRKDASEAESQILNRIRDWAQESGMALSSLKPERTEKEKSFQKSTFRATGTGGMAEITRFLWMIQTADIPICVNDLQLNARKEATDDLVAQMVISTIYLPVSPEGEPAGAVPAREVQP
jgi:hypothetical protein